MRLFELSQLRCFVAVAEELHFGRAATRLNMTQPPLSRQIQVLERILNVSLIERTSRSVRLTPAGVSFLPEARWLIRGAEQAAALARRVADGKSGSLKLAFTAASSYRFLPSVISLLSKEMPDIALALNEMVTGDQAKALLTRQVDIGFLRPPVVREELCGKAMLTEPLRVAVHQDHRLAGMDKVPIEELHGESFIMYDAQKARYFHDLLVSHFRAADILPHYEQYLTQIHSMLALVRVGLGVTIVPESAGSLHFNEVKLLPLESRLKEGAELVAAWRRDNENSPAIEKALKLIEQL